MRLRKHSEGGALGEDRLGRSGPDGRRESGNIGGGSEECNVICKVSKMVFSARPMMGDRPETSREGGRHTYFQKLALPLTLGLEHCYLFSNMVRY